MATPTVTQLSSYTDAQRGSDGQRLQPTTGYRITGGTASDRLTMDEIVADSTISGLLSYDADTGVVKRVGSSPTAYAFIFGSGAPYTTIAAGSTATVINVADATGFTDTGKVRVNNDEERDISSISGNAITLTTALSSAPNTGQRVKFLENPDDITPDCYLELVGVSFDLESNAGTDTTALDLGNTTDKIIFSDYCDVVIGSDVGDDTAPDVGNCKIISENFSWNFYNYVEVFQEGTKVTCNGYLQFVMKGNSRPSLVNRNTNSKIRVLVAAHSISPFASQFRCNFDLSVGSQEILMYGGAANFRPSLVPGGIQSDEFVLPAAVAASGGTVYLYWQNAPFAATGYTIRGLQTITEVGANEQPQVDVQSADGPGNMHVFLSEFGGKRADEFFRFSADDGAITCELRQTLNFKLRDATNAAVTAEGLKVEAGAYGASYSPTPNDTPTLLETEYMEVQDFDDVSDQSVEIAHKVFAVNQGSNQDFREVSASSILSLDLHPMRYSIWAWGYEVQYRTALTLADETGEADLIVVLPEDASVTAATKAAVVSEAATFDDLYDLLAEYAFDNEEDVAGEVANQVLTFDDANVTLADGGTMSRSSGAITIPCASTLAAGTKIKSIKATGDLTINSGVEVTGPYQDQNGIAFTFEGLPHGSDDHDDHFNHHGVVRVWPQSQGTDDRSNAITGEVADEEATTITVTLAADTMYNYVADALGYRRSPVGTLDTTSQTTVTVSLEQIVDAQGNELIPHELTTDEDSQSDLVDWDADFITIDADGVNDEISYNALVYAVEQGQSTAAACGSLLEPARIEVGRIVIPATSNQKWRAKASVTAQAFSSAINNASGYSAGDTDIVLDSVTGLTAGQTVTFDSGNSGEESKVIDSINTGTNTITLTEGLENAQADNVTVTRPESIPDLQSTGVFKDGSADQEDYIDFSNGPIKVKTEAPVFANVTGTRQTDFQGYLDNYGAAKLDQIGASIFGDAYKGVWEAGTFAVDDVTFHEDKFYKCTTARTSSNTDNPATDTSSWDVAKVEGGGGSGSLDQTTFNTRMANVPAATKDTYKGSGGGSADVQDAIDALGAIFWADDYTGEWAAGTHAVDSYVSHDNRYYKCKVARTSSHTNNPATDTTGWEETTVTVSGGTGGATLAKIVELIGYVNFGDEYAGVWSAGTYEVDDVVSHSQRYYRCLVARTSSDTTSPDLDTTGWEVIEVFSILDELPQDNTLAQADFNARMDNVPNLTKNKYRGPLPGSNKY